jgi:hypothetical protein
MAQELQTDYLTGKTVYFLVRNTVGQIWNGAAFENYTTANFANYFITATEQGTASGFYTATFPAAIAAGVYNIVSKQQVGGSPAETDISIGWGPEQWDGSHVLPLSGVPITAATTTLISSIVTGILQQNTDGAIETAAAKHSLCTAILKLLSRFDLGATETTATTYLSDGVTPKISQAITKNTALVPVQQLGVGA